MYISDPDPWPDDFVQKADVASLAGEKEEDVLARLGLPAYIVRPDHNARLAAKFNNIYFYYVYEKLEGDILIPSALIIPIPIPGTFENQILANCVLLSFDKNGKLLRYKIKQRSGRGDCLSIFKVDKNYSRSTKSAPLLGLGVNPEAANQYIHFLVRSETNPARLYYLCNAADQGNPFAQLEVGHRFAKGSDGIQEDVKSAYVWYSLAAGFVPDYASPTLKHRDASLKEIRKKMTPAQIEQAEQMLVNWRPGQCVQDLIE